MIRRYLVLTVLLHLFWEIAHMPLYTLWNSGTSKEIAFAIVHCTGGDVLIALTALISALVLFGHNRWPHYRFMPVFVAALFFGIIYTAFSEWLNIEVRASWEYTDAMPVVPLVGMGLSPLLQWIVVPPVALFWSRQHVQIRSR